MTKPNLDLTNVPYEDIEKIIKSIDIEMMSGVLDIYRINLLTEKKKLLKDELAHRILLGEDDEI